MFCKDDALASLAGGATMVGKIEVSGGKVVIANTIHANEFKF
jgi:hypothetical protein